MSKRIPLEFIFAFVYKFVVFLSRTKTITATTWSPQTDKLIYIDTCEHKYPEIYREKNTLHRSTICFWLGHWGNWEIKQGKESWDTLYASFRGLKVCNLLLHGLSYTSIEFISMNDTGSNINFWALQKNQNPNQYFCKNQTIYGTVGRMSPSYTHGKI